MKIIDITKIKEIQEEFVKTIPQLMNDHLKQQKRTLIDLAKLNTDTIFPPKI